LESIKSLEKFLIEERSRDDGLLASYQKFSTNLFGKNGDTWIMQTRA